MFYKPTANFFIESVIYYMQLTNLILLNIKRIMCVIVLNCRACFVRFMESLVYRANKKLLTTVFVFIIQMYH